jgi:hypothetical protein
VEEQNIKVQLAVLKVARAEDTTNIGLNASPSVLEVVQDVLDYGINAEETTMQDPNAVNLDLHANHLELVTRSVCLTIIRTSLKNRV